MSRTTDPVVDFDHHRLVTEQDPDEAYARLRDECPVGRAEGHGGYWVVTRHDDVAEILRTHTAYSSRDGLAIPSHFEHRIIPTEMDPPEHTVYRRVLNQYLTKDAVAALRPRVEHWTTHYIDEIIEQGSCDLVYDLALAIPAAVTLEWVGWDARDEWAKIGETWHNVLSLPLSDPRNAQGKADIGWLRGRIAQELERRRRDPRDDIITKIGALEIDGAPIPEERAIALVDVCIAGGVDTTQSLIGQSLVHLYRHPDQRRALREDPSLWEVATEEFLRRYPPVRTTARTVVGDREIGGCPLRDGDRVLVALSSANQDEDVFADPLDVRFDRGSKTHFAFGGGIHKCVGLHLARSEFTTVMSQALARLGDYVVDEERLTPYLRQSEVSGWATAPATFPPGPRIAAQTEPG